MHLEALGNMMHANKLLRDKSISLEILLTTIERHAQVEKKKSLLATNDRIINPEHPIAWKSVKNGFQDLRVYDCKVRYKRVS